MDLIDRLAWDVALAGPTPPARRRARCWPPRGPRCRSRRTRPTRAGWPRATRRRKRDAAAQRPDRGPGLRRRAPGPRTAAPRAARVLGGRARCWRACAAPRRWRARRASSQGIALLELGRYREASRVYAALAQAEPTTGGLNNYALAVLRDPVPSAAQGLGRAAPGASTLDPESVDLAFNLAWALLAEDDPAGAAFQLKSLTQVVPARQAHARGAGLGAAARGPRAGGGPRVGGGGRPGPGLRDPHRARPLAPLRADPCAASAPSSWRARAAATPQVAAALYLKAQRLFDGGRRRAPPSPRPRAPGYLDPYNRAIHLLLARLHRARGDGEKALNEFRMALWSEDDAAVRVEVAGLLREMGRPAEARAEAARALALAPGNEAARKLAASAAVGCVIIEG